LGSNERQYTLFSQKPFRLIATNVTTFLVVQLEMCCVDPSSIILAAGTANALSHHEGTDLDLAIDGLLDDQQGWACGNCGGGAAILFAFRSPSMVRRCELTLFETPLSRLLSPTQEVCCEEHFSFAKCIIGQQTSM
jgi:hypothetical protein